MPSHAYDFDHRGYLVEKSSQGLRPTNVVPLPQPVAKAAPVQLLHLGAAPDAAPTSCSTAAATIS